MTAEYLVAIAVRTGRAKDYTRILQFLEQNAVDTYKLTRILTCHGLVPKWKRFERKYVEASMPVFVNMQGEGLRGYKYWFIPAVSEAGLRDFT